MARKRKVKEAPWEGENILPKRTAFPKPPFTLADRGAFIRNHFVAVHTTKTGAAYEVLAFSFANGLVETLTVNGNMIDLTHTGGKQFYVHDVEAGFDKAMARDAKNRLAWLKGQALKGGATPDAIRLLSKAVDLTKKEEEVMAKAAKETAGKLAKKSKTTTDADAGAAPVGGGGKAAATKPAKKGGKGNPEALKKAREAKAAAGPDTRKIKIVNKENPYRDGSNRAASFDALKGAKTVEDYVSAGGKTKYLSRWESEGRITLG